MLQPVTVFLRQSMLLRAAVAACLDKPKPKPVHQLRSASRRLEATLELLTAKAEIAGLRASAKPLQRSLRRIRRAAGAVRDFDVHRELLDRLRDDEAAARLRDKLHRARDKAARKLHERLGKEEPRIRHALAGLEAALRPAIDLELSGAALAGFARSWLAGAVRKLDIEQDDQLHAVRKAAKTARYLAENDVESSKVAAGLAARCEAAQKKLGDWHDHLLLLKEAKASLDEDSRLTENIERTCLKLRLSASAAAQRLVRSSSTLHRSRVVRLGSRSRTQAVNR